MIAFKRRSRGKKFTYTHHNIYIYIYIRMWMIKKLNVIVKVTTVLIYFFGLRDR
jgi:hypothetical protein